MAWHERIAAAAASQPGYVSSELQPPDSAHPGEWVTVYSFVDAEHLDAWLASSVRDDIVSDAQELLEGPIREQRVAALRTAPEPVTVVFSQRITPDGDSAFTALYDDVVRRLEVSSGLLGSQLLRPVPGVQDDHVIVASFASRSDLDGWLESDARQSWLEEVADLIEGERTVNVVGGFGGWIGPADRGDGSKPWPCCWPCSPSPC